MHTCLQLVVDSNNVFIILSRLFSVRQERIVCLGKVVQKSNEQGLIL